MNSGTALLRLGKRGGFRLSGHFIHSV